MTQAPWSPNQEPTPLTSGQGLKPTWKGLKRGGDFRTPVSEFIGQFTDWSTYPNRFGDTAVALKFDRIQVLDQDAPYPYPQLDLEIKYSDQENSIWGKFGISLATCMGVELDYMDIDQPKGQWFHMVRYDNEPFGWNDKATGKPVTGFIWRCHAILQPGQSVTSAYRAAQEYQEYMEALNLKHGVITVAALPIPAAPIASAGFNPAMGILPATPSLATAPPPPTPAAPAISITPEQQALSLLSGADLATFFQKAMSDETIRTDPTLVNSILSGSWLASMEAAGKVTQQPDGLYMVHG